MLLTVLRDLLQYRWPLSTLRNSPLVVMAKSSVSLFTVARGVDFGKGPLQGRERKTQLWVNTYFCNPEKVRLLPFFKRSQIPPVHLQTTGGSIQFAQ